MELLDRYEFEMLGIILLTFRPVKCNIDGEIRAWSINDLLLLFVDSCPSYRIISHILSYHPILFKHCSNLFVAKQL